jgi:hypothetical protein
MHSCGNPSSIRLHAGGQVLAIQKGLEQIPPVDGIDYDLRRRVC